MAVDDSCDETCRVLVADFEDELGCSLETLLRDEGYAVRGARRVQVQAITADVDAFAPHALVLGSDRATRKAASLCRVLSRRYPDLRIVLLGAQADPQAVAGQLDAGADDVVPRSFAPEELLARLRARLRRRPRLLGAGGMQTGIAFQALGGFRIVHGGTDVTSQLWNRRQPVSLLKILMARCPARATTDELVEMLWPHLGFEAGQRSLHLCVQRARAPLRAFGGERVQRVGGGYALRLLPGDTLDTLDVERLARDCHEALSQPEALTVGPFQRLGDLYAGDLFADDWSMWIVPIRRRLRRMVLELLAAADDRLVREKRDSEAMRLRHRIEALRSAQEGAEPALV